MARTPDPITVLIGIIFSIVFFVVDLIIGIIEDLPPAATAFALAGLGAASFALVQFIRLRQTGVIQD